MKIKIIELLNKIANGQEVPKKIKYSGDILKYDEECQDYMGVSKTASGSFFNYLFVNKATESFINDEVKIIEEDKPIEELKETQENDYMLRYPNNKELMNKINELVKEINKLKENK